MHGSAVFLDYTGSIVHKVTSLKMKTCLTEMDTSCTSKSLLVYSHLLYIFTFLTVCVHHPCTFIKTAFPRKVDSNEMMHVFVKLHHKNTRSSGKVAAQLVFTLVIKPHLLIPSVNTGVTQ